MTGLVVFWGVLAMAGLAFAVVTRVFPLSFAALGFAFAAILAWQGGAIWMQVLISAVLLGLGLYFWVLRTRVDYMAERESASARLTGMPSLSQFSVFSEESDEIHIERWESDQTSQVIFRGREWRVRLAKGARAHPGLYKVREVRDGMLILDEVID